MGKSTEAVVDRCSKCAEPMDIAVKAGTAKWCKKCRAQYQEEYRQTVKQQDWHAGVAAMREYFAGSMEGYPPLQRWTGAEIAAIMRRVSGPKFPDMSLPGAVS